jgi:hypothetical protein
MADLIAKIYASPRDVIDRAKTIME